VRLSRRLFAPIAVAALLAAIILAPTVVGHFRDFQFAFVAIYLIALLGLNILTGYTGQISLGHGAFMGIGAYTTAILTHDHGWRDLWTIPVAGVVAGAVGLLFGIPATRFAGPYLALATFAIPLTFIALLKRFQGFTGGSLGKSLHLLRPEFGVSAHPNVWLYYLSWIVAVAMFLLAWLLVRSRLGRSLRAVRDSEIAATANGISVAELKTLAFGISAAYCGVAGALYAIGVAYVNPDTFPIDLSILLLVGVVVSGAGSLGGMLFGALFVEFIRISWAPWLLHAFNQVTSLNLNERAPGSPLVIYGTVLLLVLFALPSGVAGLGRTLSLSARRTYSRSTTTPQASSPRSQG
jgi:branched-chain amino acid transport system permease protein